MLRGWDAAVVDWSEEMNGESNWAGWFAAIALFVSAVLMAGATLMHMGSNPIGFTIICLVGAGVLYSYLKKD